MNEETVSIPPKMFYWISGAALVWNLLGVMTYVAQVTISAEALAEMPEAQRALYENMPALVTAAFAIAVNAGAVGCLLLIRRRVWALPVFILSLAGAIVQTIHNFFLTNAIEVMGAASTIGPIAIIVIGAYLIWFAKESKKKGWIS